MERQFSAVCYWLGLISAALALIFRALAALNIIPPHMGAPGGLALSYLSFMHGAELFLLVAIASACVGSRTQKP